jgi:hypothetical protein
MTNRVQIVAHPLKNETTTESSKVAGIVRLRFRKSRTMAGS